MTLVDICPTCGAKGSYTVTNILTGHKYTGVRGCGRGHTWYEATGKRVDLIRKTRLPWDEDEQP